jgi:GNAT superfamily N-acetyltransferase
MPVHVRQAGTADLETIVEFNRRLAHETEGKVLDVAALRGGVGAALADPERRGPYFLAEQDGEVVGQLQFTYEWSDWRNGWFWWVQSVYVRADVRGQGVFRALFAHVEQMARRRGDVVGLRLYVETGNHAAQATYARLGLTSPGYLMLEKSLR